MKAYFSKQTLVGTVVGFVLLGLTVLGVSAYREYSDYTTNVKPFVYALKQRALELQQQAQRAQQQKAAPVAQPEQK